MADNFNVSKPDSLRAKRVRLKLAFFEAFEIYDRLNDSESLAKLLEAENAYLHYIDHHD